MKKFLPFVLLLCLVVSVAALSACGAPVNVKGRTFQVSKITTQNFSEAEEENIKQSFHGMIMKFDYKGRAWFVNGDVASEKHQYVQSDDLSKVSVTMDENDVMDFVVDGNILKYKTSETVNGVVKSYTLYFVLVHEAN